MVDETQVIDFSSSYFEGKSAEMAEYGYSRDHRSDKKQIVWGITTGINGIPSALTIKRGNVQDKAYMREMLQVSFKIVEKGSLLMYDCGGNSPWIKDKIIKNGYNYLTLKAKKAKIYRKHIKGFENECSKIEIDGKEYFAVKRKSDRREH